LPDLKKNKRLEKFWKKIPEAEKKKTAESQKELLSCSTRVKQNFANKK